MGLFDFLAKDPTGANTYPAMEARRRIALQLLSNSRKGYPKNLGEGLTAIGDAIGDRGVLNQLAQQEGVYAKAAAAAGEAGIPAEARLPGQQSEDTTLPAPMRTAYAPTGDIQAPPPTNSGFAPAVTQTPVGTADLTPEEKTIGVTSSGINPLDVAADTDPWAARRRAVAGIESGGAKNPYSLTGAATRTGDRAVGKYQVMGANIPDWTKAATGTALTPAQFRANPAAQEATFQNQFGQYADKYGDQGAAKAWFAGEGGMNNPNATDVHGRLNVAQYGQDYLNRFNAGGGRDAIAAQLAQRQEGAPLAALPFSGQAPSDLPPEITEGRSAIQAAPRPPPIQAAPQQVAQNARVEVPTQRTPLPQDVPMTAEEKQGWQMMAKARALGDPSLIQQAQSLITYGAGQRKDRYDAVMADYKDRLLFERQRALAGEQRAYEAPEREQRIAKAKQDMEQGAITPQPSAPPTQMAGPGVPAGYDPRLGTDASPQRTGVPAAPPVPPGISPAQHAAQQAPLLTQGVVAVDKAMPEFKRALDEIQQIRKHPGKDWGLGLTGSVAGQFPTEAKDFLGRVEQLKNQTFLQAYNTLRGGGQISNVEGEKAQQAQARLDPKNIKGFDAALNDLEKQLRSDLEVAQRKVNRPVTAWPIKGAPGVAPDIGQRRGDWQYIGGAPDDQNSWRQVQ